jgi:signal transduction histidine kinase
MGRGENDANGSLTAGDLRQNSMELPPSMLNAEVARYFEADKEVPAFAIVDGEVPVGLIDRLGFMSRFASRYGREIYAGKPITRLMDPAPLVVESTTPVDAVANMIFADRPGALTTGFILVRDGAFDGVATGIDLLQALAASLAAANERLLLTQETLVQSEKMAALGALVAGVAHEVNTPIGSALTAATAFAERVRGFAERTTQGGMRRSDISRFVDGALEATSLIHSNIGRAAALIAGFKQLAVDQSDDVRCRFQLKRRLEDVLMSLSPRLRKAGVATELVCSDSLEMDGYPGALAQIVTNLTMNALTHAFDDRADKRLTVTVRSLNGEAVSLEISDNGRGVPAEVKPRIFDPFFTTRRGSGGSGLGLHIVYNLTTQRFGGSITVEDAAPSGARFRVVLPLSAPGA